MKSFLRQKRVCVVCWIAMLAVGSGSSAQQQKSIFKFEASEKSSIEQEFRNNPKLIFDNLHKNHLPFQQFFLKFENEARQNLRTDPELQVSTLTLMKRDCTTGGLPDIGGSVRQYFELRADYFSLAGNAHHSSMVLKGFFVVYQHEILLYENGNQKRKVDRIDVMGFAENLTPLVPSNEEFVERSANSLENFLSTVAKEKREKPHANQ
jgi:hypothetical protein